MPSLARPTYLIKSHQRSTQTERSHLKFHDPHAALPCLLDLHPEPGDDESLLDLMQRGPAHRALLLRQIDLGDHLRVRFDNRVRSQMPSPVCRQD